MNAPNTPTLASHQMCQISAKPTTTAKKAVTKPVALFFGISTGSYLRAGVGSSFVTCARLLLFQNASSPATLAGTQSSMPAAATPSPFERAAVPRITGHVAQLLAITDRHNELHDLANDADQDDSGAECRRYQPRLPGQIVVMLHAPGHAHQAQHVERHEGDIEADEPAPERGFAPTFVELEPNTLGNQ